MKYSKNLIKIIENYGDHYEKMNLINFSGASVGQIAVFVFGLLLTLISLGATAVWAIGFLKKEKGK
jgi:hypothetical protein